MLTQFIVQKSLLQKADFLTAPLPALESGEVLFEIDSFAFTANNITYSLIGEQYGYWRFFPTDVENGGIIPVWGFAQVVESEHPAVEIGERFYGYFPMASHLKVKPGEVREVGFVDVAMHRQPLPAVYNYYFNTAHYAGYTPESEGTQSLFRPLFTTSFLIDDFLAENHFFESVQIILTSASSKTAIALAFCLAQRKKNSSLDFQMIGLTSKSNSQFTENLGLYDMVLHYDSIHHIPRRNTVIVDFSGNQSLQYELQKQLENELKYNCLVGLAHGTNAKANQIDLPQKGVVFFAPTYAQKRTKELGALEFQKIIGNAWVAFLPQAQESLQIKPIYPKEWHQAYMDTLEGKISPNMGLIFLTKEKE